MIKLPLLAKCKVYPKGTWYFFLVCVWKRRKDMLQALRQGHVEDIEDCEAICVTNTVYACAAGKSHMTGCLGQIHFHQNSFMMGIITHESAHAALAWARRVGVNVTEAKPENQSHVSGAEESFCWVLGNISRQIVLKVNRQWKFPGGQTKGISYV